MVCCEKVRSYAVTIGAACAAAGTAYSLYSLYKASTCKPVKKRDDKKAFADAFNRLVADVMHDESSHPQDCMKWVREMIEYTVPGGKNTRGLSVLQGVKCLNERILDDDETHYRVCALGWCIEWLQGMFLVADDIMDNSVTRRGKKCWYRNEHVGMIAVNDALMLDALIYRILKMYFKDTDCYTSLLELFHEVTYDTTAGELCDLLTAPIGQVDLSRYTMEKYQYIVKYKTSLYSFYLPVACAMIVSGVKDKAAYETAREVCCHIGEYFQIQDDYLDCYGDPEVIGKVGTDIEDNKCSWLVCKALLLADKKQLEVLKANYGREEKGKVAKVKQLFKEMNLEGIYNKYEEESYATMKSIIDTRVDTKSKPLYMWLLKRIYKRTK
uniref:Farnesyl pyrophosphate synthase n=1 Tax=Pyramimonas obovata TaxID=1411642 RepID=A0A7S0WQW2_9CHLO